MDVRAVDTSTLAAKRVELEHGHPLKDKGAFVIGRITARTAEDSGGRVGRAKSSTERDHSQGREHDEHQAPGHYSPQSGHPGEQSDAPPEEHHLDVKV